MDELTGTLLEGSAVPIEVSGWGVLLAGLVIVGLWLLYVYR
ncbi:hypothetical protein ACLI4U_05140 [Natrialbaceae archaeon A-CW2]|nr:hypothetical protein [Natronosalvus amylolyticus]